MESEDTAELLRYIVISGDNFCSRICAHSGRSALAQAREGAKTLQGNETRGPTQPGAIPVYAVESPPGPHHWNLPDMPAARLRISNM